MSPEEIKVYLTFWSSNKWYPISGDNVRFLGLDIKTGLLNVYLEEITLPLVMIWFFSPLQRLCASFWNKMWDTAMSVFVAKYLHWPVSITYSEHISIWLSTDVKQLDILKYGVGFFFVVFLKTLLWGLYSPWHRGWGMRCAGSWKWEQIALWVEEILSENSKVLWEP